MMISYDRPTTEENRTKYEYNDRLQQIRPILEALDPTDIQLIELKEFYFDGSWQALAERIKEITRVNPGLERIIRRIEALQKAEKENEVCFVWFLPLIYKQKQEKKTG